MRRKFAINYEFLHPDLMGTLSGESEKAWPIRPSIVRAIADSESLSISVADSSYDTRIEPPLALRH